MPRAPRHAPGLMSSLQVPREFFADEGTIPVPKRVSPEPGSTRALEIHVPKQLSPLA